MSRAVLPNLNEVLASLQSDRTPVHLLAGNGFTLESGLPFAMPIINHHASTYPLGTKAMQLLTNIPSIASEDALSYVENFPALNPHNNDQTTEYILLRDALVEGIIDAHPQTQYAVPPATRLAAVRLFDCFNSVFTTNYDLMAHWAAQGVSGASPFTDGFRSSVDRYSEGQPVEVFRSDRVRGTRRIWYLHGAIHLYQYRQRVGKLKIDAGDASPQRLIRDAREVGFSPLIVLEGRSERKKAEIADNLYLRRASRDFAQLKGALVTFGFGFNWQDAHLVDDLLNNQRLQSIWIGLHGNPFSVPNTEMKYRIRERCSTISNDPDTLLKRIQYYQSENAFNQIDG